MNPTQLTEAPELAGGKVQAVQREGKSGLAHRLLNRIKRGFQLKDAYVLIVTNEDLNQVPPPSIEVEWMELTHPDESELKALAAFHFHTNSPEDVVRYLAEGQQCFVAKVQGQVVSGFWIQKKELYDFRNQRSIQLADDEQYALGGFTAPEFRGKGILAYLYATALAEKHRRFPALKTVIFVDIHNHSSLRMTEKIGFRKVGRNGYIELFGTRFKYILGRNVLPETKKRFLVSL